ncbi:aerobic-type carbon monoxide dehydrogenase, middle subunit CoxM/CutM-like protein [Rivularia sp. PCC 7116]|uniref:FAD binding domain-containing protein n=1 Tax=Rivularia sp. PCC 7116 TaxID=373994 RepID=UPI00029EE897|nr:FAD binding domain-containing protein [Rivularia sp. PCC 7116]AFY54707.1 aerobic-type carbon monoxide dehydrogenase, middle subunit CoxM/CutM-like protein [Rivularia sp. PCC 7116]
MDLHNIDNYLIPTDINQVTNWGKDWSWLAGGTWLFSEPQPDIKTLVDIQSLGWDEIEFVNPRCEAGLNNNLHYQGELLAIGATCPLIKLVEYDCLPEYIAVEGFRGAINALSASLKVVNTATVGGNICLGLSVGTIAPIMVALDASYEIWNREEKSRIVAAKDFQIASRQTVLQSGELLRRILIPVENMKWQVNYKRFGIAASDSALAIVCGAYNSVAKNLRVVIGASVAAPVLLQLDGDLEHKNNLNYIASLENIDFIEDTRASAVYRREITQVLIKQCFEQLTVDS